MTSKGEQREDPDAFRAEDAARRRRLRWGIAAGIALALCAVVGLAIHVRRQWDLTVAVAPRGSVASALVVAFSDALSADHKFEKLEVATYDGLRDTAAALQDGRADLAVVRPDVALPTDGMTVAVLQREALIVASPAAAGLTSLAKAGGKRFGLLSRGDDDVALLRTLLGYYGLTLEAASGTGRPAGDAVAVVPLDIEAVASSLRSGTVDAAVILALPSAPQAVVLVAAVASASKDGHVAFVAVDDDDAIADRFPLLETMKIHGGLYGGRPKLPADDVKVVGVSYRLQARTTLGRTVTAKLTENLFALRPALARSTDAAFGIRAPSYDDTRAATSAPLPIHPGAIDYYERDQEGLVDRYSDLLYPVAILASGLVSVLAWGRTRIVAMRRHRIDLIVSDLLTISAQLRNRGAPADHDRVTDEIEALAAAAVRCARDDDLSAQLMTAATIAIDGARKALNRRQEHDGQPSASLRSAQDPNHPS